MASGDFDAADFDSADFDCGEESAPRNVTLELVSASRSLGVQLVSSSSFAVEIV
jgi:hypothetical protein